MSDPHDILVAVQRVAFALARYDIPTMYVAYKVSEADWLELQRYFARASYNAGQEFTGFTHLTHCGIEIVRAT